MLTPCSTPLCPVRARVFPAFTSITCIIHPRNSFTSIHFPQNCNPEHPPQENPTSLLNILLSSDLNSEHAGNPKEWERWGRGERKPPDKGVETPETSEEPPNLQNGEEMMSRRRQNSRTSSGNAEEPKGFIEKKQQEGEEREWARGCACGI